MVLDGLTDAAAALIDSMAAAEPALPKSVDVSPPPLVDVVVVFDDGVAVVLAEGLLNMDENVFVNVFVIPEIAVCVVAHGGVGVLMLPMPPPNFNDPVVRRTSLNVADDDIELNGGRRWYPTPAVVDVAVVDIAVVVIVVVTMKLGAVFLDDDGAIGNFLCLMSPPLMMSPSSS